MPSLRISAAVSLLPAVRS